MKELGRFKIFKYKTRNKIGTRYAPEMLTLNTKLNTNLTNLTNTNLNTKYAINNIIWG